VESIGTEQRKDKGGGEDLADHRREESYGLVVHSPRRQCMRRYIARTNAPHHTHEHVQHHSHTCTRREA
jgi:hypothetical protein